MGGASKWWLHHSLKALQASLGKLIVLEGNPAILLPELARQVDAKKVTWTRDYDPHSVARDSEIKTLLADQNISVESFGTNVLAEPWQVKTQADGPFKVFTPFFKALKAQGYAPPVAAPTAITIADISVPSLEIDTALPLPQHPDWAASWSSLWTPGEAGAHAQFEAFVAGGLAGYGTLRDRPDLPNVSRLSPHFHFGEITPRQIISVAAMLADGNPALSADVDKLYSELGWREFSRHLLFHYPQIVTQNWKPAFDHYPWVNNADQLKAWQSGQTGYPMVDAGMRELWQTGYMHNRVRMLTASFLVKHLRIHWRYGERWFWDTLVDADLPNNCASWQWVAGSGADAAPYFRIFNPIDTGTKSSIPMAITYANGAPNLHKLPTKYHPRSPTRLLQQRSARQLRLIRLGRRPILIRSSITKTARTAALAGYETIMRQDEQWMTLI